jgi:hypothetical protein
VYRRLSSDWLAVRAGTGWSGDCECVGRAWEGASMFAEPYMSAGCWSRERADTFLKCRRCCVVTANASSGRGICVNRERNENARRAPLEWHCWISNDILISSEFLLIHDCCSNVCFNEFVFEFSSSWLLATCPTTSVWKNRPAGHWLGNFWQKNCLILLI